MPEGVRLRRVLEAAGGVYMKLGQIAATRVDLLPPEVCDELAGCRTALAAEPVDRMSLCSSRELGGETSQMFAELRLGAARRRIHRADVPRRDCARARPSS